MARLTTVFVTATYHQALNLALAMGLGQHAWEWVGHPEQVMGLDQIRFVVLTDYAKRREDYADIMQRISARPDCTVIHL